MPRGALYQMYKRSKKTEFTFQLQYYVKQSIQLYQAQKSLRWLERIYYTQLKRNSSFKLKQLLLTDIDRLKLFIFYRGLRVVFIKLQENKIVSGFSQTKQHIYFIFILTCFGHIRRVQPKRCNVSLFISVVRSTCFRRCFRPSSGARNVTYSVRYLSDQYCYLLLAWPGQQQVGALV